MRALQCEQYGPPENVRVVNCSEPGDPGPGNVIIRVRYASVSHAVGLMVAGRYQTRPSLPFVPGTEAVGHVISVGSEVRGLEPGMAVLVVNNWGCYAETICVPDSTVYPIPDGVDLLQALPLAISYGTAFTGLVWRCAIQPGDNVLVMGAGAGVGLAAVELASLLGATVIACASTEEKEPPPLIMVRHLQLRRVKTWPATSSSTRRVKAPTLSWIRSAANCRDMPCGLLQPMARS